MADFKVMVVDDEMPVLEVMRDLLQEAGWQVQAFTSPLQALRAAKRDRYDALVLDVYMPELPGMLFHAKLKVVDRELAQRTIFVSGHFSREELKRDLEREAVLISKPFTPDELAGAVKDILPERPRAA